MSDFTAQGVEEGIHYVEMKDGTTWLRAYDVALESCRRAFGHPYFAGTAKTYFFKEHPTARKVKRRVHGAEPGDYVPIPESDLLEKFIKSNKHTIAVRHKEFTDYGKDMRTMKENAAAMTPRTPIAPAVPIAPAPVVATPVVAKPVVAPVYLSPVLTPTKDPSVFKATIAGGAVFLGRYKGVPYFSSATIIGLLRPKIHRSAAKFLNIRVQGAGMVPQTGHSPKLAGGYIPLTDWEDIVSIVFGRKWSDASRLRGLEVELTWAGTMLPSEMPDLAFTTRKRPVARTMVAVETTPTVNDQYEQMLSELVEGLDDPDQVVSEQVAVAEVVSETIKETTVEPSAKRDSFLSAITALFSKGVESIIAEVRKAVWFGENRFNDMKVDLDTLKVNEINSGVTLKTICSDLEHIRSDNLENRKTLERVEASLKALHVSRAPRSLFGFKRAA
jgi:hypothetical protein